MRRLCLILLALQCSFFALHAEGIKGDINGDGQLTFDDVTLLKDIFLGKAPTQGNLDINADGVLSVADITKLVNMVMNKTEGGLDVGIGGWEEGDEDFGGVVSVKRREEMASVSMNLPAMQLQPGETVDVAIAMNNQVLVNGFQLTVSLPSGFEFVAFESGAYAELERKVGSHIIDNSAITDNKLTIISYSTANSAYPENSGNLLKIKVKAVASRGTYSVGISNAEVSDESFRPIHPTISVGDITLKNKYTLTVNAEGNGSVNNVSGEYWEGTSVTVTAMPDEGYKFTGWSDGNAENPRTIVVNSNIALTAQFTPQSYTLTYYVDGALYKTESYAFGSTITPLAEPEKEGHTFSGWSEIPSTMPAHDVEVNGSFSVNTYKISYYVDGELYKTESYEFGAEVTPLPEPTLEGYIFSGWSEIPEIMPAHDVEVSGSFVFDGIEGIRNNDESATVYDLNGRIVGQKEGFNQLPAGIYIINGKKIKKGLR